MESAKKKVLVIDDSEIVLDVVQSILEDAGYEVVCSANPFGSFLALTREQPDLVLLDLSMPGIEGDVLLQVIKESGLTHSAKIVIHSSRDEAALARIAAEIGADGYIQKSSDPDEFLAAIARWLH
ncbi:MAG: hypothetical protein AUK47_14910 [Deltaproteobacteria bacterium CG2_30_63_29]|nr:MAG: hypothetical protein AUK47_14910 [Deltaproteobacteria bacterium CG2_30_63_29]PIW01925.1 MAG: hypothetical protein COW42_03350 [Deltaproteobacteria bacterium CG17_big_fil_post_rev_8_21_14_2_50_63_7]